MSNPLTFIRPLRYDRVKTVLVVQTGPATLLPGIVECLRGLFPGCSIDVLLREADKDVSATLGAEQTEVARWEERFELVSRLRRRRFDAIVLQVGGDVTNELRALPFILRGRALIAFNDRLDYFPLNVFRLSAVAQHFGVAGGESGGSGVLWLVRRVVSALVVPPATLVVLVLSAGWIHVRGWVRRARRRSRTARHAEPPAGRAVNA
jgi:hypothetical protein